AVSIAVNSISPSLASPMRRSRVTPGWSSTSATRLPISRLNSVLLPTLARPTIATEKRMGDEARATGAAPGFASDLTQRDPGQGEGWACGCALGHGVGAGACCGGCCPGHGAGAACCGAGCCGGGCCACAGHGACACCTGGACGAACGCGAGRGGRAGFGRLTLATFGFGFGL